jgi:hypothetical protein
MHADNSVSVTAELTLMSLPCIIAAFTPALQTLHASRCAAAVFGGDDSVSQIKRALARYLAGCAGPTSGPLGPHSMKMSDLGKVLEKIAPQVGAAMWARGG